MNVTYIIGNGFDINIGLKTNYSAFYEYYKQIENQDEDIIALKNDIETNITQWSDLEEKLGQYTEYVDSIDTMIKIIKDVTDNLKAYLNDIILTLPPTNAEAKQSLLSDFISPEKYFPRADKDSIINFYNKFNSSNPRNIDVISLNYTPIIEHVLDYDNKSSIEHNNTVNGKLSIFRTVYHLHHELSDSIDDTLLIGVNDESQIGNTEFRNSQLLREWLIKPITNEMLQSKIDNDCEDIISNTHLFVLFGVSIGNTDKRWWEAICNRMANTNDCRLIMFEYNTSLKENDCRMLNEYKRQTIDKLISKTNFTEKQSKELKEKIYIAFNSNIFSTVKKYITPLSYQQGSFTINYSNNNGEFVIGHDKKQFTTKWSKASDVSIHAYNDAVDIESIGLVSGDLDFNQLNIENIDFSSRSRTPQIGDSVIWKNRNGYYAATKIIRIKDDSRNDDVDELECQYVIYK